MISKYKKIDKPYKATGNVSPEMLKKNIDLVIDLLNVLKMFYSFFI